MQDTVQPATNVAEFVEPIYRAKFWLQLIGVMLILGGLFTALTIIGILICWIPIWAGIALMQAAGSVDQAYTTGSAEAATQAMQRLKTYFTIFGVLTLVYIAISVLGIIFGVGAGMMSGMGGMGGMGG